MTRSVILSDPALFRKGLESRTDLIYKIKSERRPIVGVARCRLCKCSSCGRRFLLVVVDFQTTACGILNIPDAAGENHDGDDPMPDRSCQLAKHESRHHRQSAHHNRHIDAHSNPGADKLASRWLLMPNHEWSVAVHGCCRPFLRVVPKL